MSRVIERGNYRPVPIEYGLIDDKAPQREGDRWVVSHAPAILWELAEQDWKGRSLSLMKEGIDKSNCQVVVLPSPYDVTTPFYKDLLENPLGFYPVAMSSETIFSDGEPNPVIKGESAEASSVYLVTSLKNSWEYMRVIAVADHYKRTLNAQVVTLVASFMGMARGDKNVDRDGNYVANPILLRSHLQALATAVDRLIVTEPHSSATQAYGYGFGMSVAPISVWSYMLSEVTSRKTLTPENAVFFGPDMGRNIAATRAARILGLPVVSFKKVRTSGTEAFLLNDLTKKEQRLIKGRVGVVYDDEAETLGTLFKIAEKTNQYGLRELVVCLAHCKFTHRWREKIEHPLFSLILGTDSRSPVGNIAIEKIIDVVSLAPFLRRLIEADIEGVNFWQDPRYRDLILQPQPEER